MGKKKKPKIQYRINEIKKISHFENDFGDLGLKQKDLEGGSVKIFLQMIVNEKTNLIKFKSEAIFFVKIKEKEIDLFGATTMNKFEIKDMLNVFERDDKNQLIIPEDFIKILLNIVVGSLRGIISMSRTNKEYSRIYLPVLNLQDLFKSIQTTKTK